MEKMLLKMARQLNSMDEASLMALWNRYMERVQDFDASQEWEEAAIVLSLIQAVRGKNMLFNVKWAERERARNVPSSPRYEDMRPWRRMSLESDREKEQARPKQRARVHQFRPLS